MSIRLGILGASAICPIAVINPAKEIEGIEVVAVAARDPERAAEYASEHGIERVLPDYQSVLEDPNIDAVYIPTPAALHGHWTKQAISAGKPVLCEKPFTANGKEARQVAESAEESGVLVMEAMHSLHHPLWAKAREILTSGSLGEIRSVVAEFSWPIADPDDIRWNLELAGGALMDLGVYPLTLLRYLFPTLELKSAHAEAKGNVDGFVEAKFTSVGAAEVTLITRMDATAVPIQRLEVLGSEGTLTFDQFVHVHEGGKLTVVTGGSEREILAEGPSSYARMLQTFIRGITAGNDVVTDAAAAVATMEAIDEIYEAVSLPPRQPLPLV